MTSRYLLIHVLCLLLITSFAASQIPTPSRQITTQDVLTVTENLWPSSLSTNTVPGATYTFDAAFTLSTTVTASGAKATYSNQRYFGLEGHDVSVVPGYNVSLVDILENPVCYFPTSSQWSLLPRIVFYMTLVFALVARKHEWLIGGALAAALAYSSLAALQMSFQVWTHQALAELDLLAMTGVLATSCIIAVPLMNWSSTIQRLGLEEFDFESPEGEHIKQEFKKKKEYGSTRIVLVFWNVIVAIGFLAAFAGIVSYLQSVPWIDFTITLNIDTISCVPSSGELDPTAGQLPGWDSFWLTSEFINQNNCVDPCSSSSFDGTLFRSPSELHSFSMGDVDHFFEQKHVSRSARRNIHFVDIYYDYLLFLVPFIILQGIMQMLLFWRSTPQRARWRIYCGLLEMRKIKVDTEIPTAYTRFAFWTALIFYIFAVFVLLVSPAAFILSIVATELALTWTPQSETNAHVDQWAPFAVLILVLLAALISRVAPGVRRSIKAAELETKYSYYTYQIRRLTDVNYTPVYPEPQLYRLTWIDRVTIIWRRMYEASSYKKGGFLESAEYLGNDFLLLLQYEWHLSGQFWNYPYKKPERRAKETSRKWKHSPPHSYKNDELQEQISLIKRRKREVKEAKKQFKKLQLRGAQEKHPHAPFPSSASSFDQPFRDVEAMLIVNENRPHTPTGQGLNPNSDSTPLLSSNASERRRSGSGASNNSAGEVHLRTLPVHEPQEPSQAHVAEQRNRIRRQRSWRSANDSLPEPPRPDTYSYHATRGISPVSTSMSLRNNQGPSASLVQVSEINSLRRQQTSASSTPADQKQENDLAILTAHTNEPYIDRPHTDIQHNDTPYANNLDTHPTHTNPPTVNPSVTNSRHQSLEQLNESETNPEVRKDHNPEPEELQSRRHSTSSSLRSDHRSHSYTERSNSPISIVNQRVSIVHELPPIDIDSSFNFHFDTGH